MNPFVEQFRDLSTEYLLQRRALGEEGLVPEAHRAIELILSERGVSIPPMPSRPINVSEWATEPRRSTVARNAVLVGGALIAMGVAKALAVTWAGLVLTTGVAMYMFVAWLHRKSLSEGERAAEVAQQQAERDGLTELMQAAAAGDAARVTELISYGANVNEQSGIGSTAMMYAAKNNHAEIVNLLLAAGANPALRTEKGSTAADLAARAGHQEVVTLLGGRLSSPT